MSLCLPLEYLPENNAPFFNNIVYSQKSGLEYGANLMA